MTNTIQIDHRQCVRCGQCVRICPSQSFTHQGHNDPPTLTPHAGDVCIQCGHCVVGCAGEAITVNQWRPEVCQTVPMESLPRFEHISTLARMRRSTRYFEDKPLEVAKLESLLDIVRWAPSARNLQPIRWIVIQSREKIVELGNLVVEVMRKHEQYTRQVEAWDAGNDMILRGAPSLVIAVTGPDAIFPEVDSAIAVETLDLCAAAMRLGSCWAGYFMRSAQTDTAIQSWLGLKKSETVQAALFLGYPATAPYKRIPFRKELEIKWIS